MIPENYILQFSVKILNSLETYLKKAKNNSRKCVFSCRLQFISFLNRLVHFSHLNGYSSLSTSELHFNSDWTKVNLKILPKCFLLCRTNVSRQYMTFPHSLQANFFFFGSLLSGKNKGRFEFAEQLEKRGTNPNAGFCDFGVLSVH